MMFDEDDRIFVEMQNKHRNQNTPKSLYDISLTKIVHDLTIICHVRTDIISSPLRLKDDIVLPREICERILEAYQKRYAVSDKFIDIFKDRSKTRIKTVHLDGSVVTDAGFKLLTRHNLQSITLTKCENLTLASLEEISHRSSKLVSLHVGGNVDFFNEWAAEWDKRGFAFRAPRLRRLVLHRQPCPNLRLELLPTLTHLDLSECLYLFNLHTMSPLKNLSTLILYNVPKLHELFDWICSLKKLQMLDMSQCSYEGGQYDCPNQVLTRIVESLPELESLDISGTNLAGTGVAEGGCDVPGLASRITRPLDFLGLYGTQHAACCRHDIPAIKITGHANENQIMTASIAYMKRPEFLTRVLNDLYHLFRYENDKHPSVPKSLCVVLESMETHLAEKHIQISGSATLFYIVKGKEKSSLPIEMKQRIVSALLNGMETHMDDDTMMRNGCLTLCQFKIPTDVMFEYKRIVTVLLHGVADSSQEGFVQRIAIYLLNSLACQVDGRQKQFLGDSGAISKMLVLIADRLERRVCDDVLEVAWSTMWNVTDETPDNCKRFLDDNGLYFFLTCLERFPGKEELLRNMMGLLGNVAEVAHLRPVFMDTQLLQVFSELLESTSDGIEVSYNAVGVLAHLASDGPAAWSVTVPVRSEVLKRMDDAIKRWNLSTKRNINYRSFQPILSLLGAYHTPACQYWALWALANLTTVYPEKYCSLVEAEKGGDLLKEVIDHPDPCDDIKTLAKLVWHNCYY